MLGDRLSGSVAKRCPMFYQGLVYDTESLEKVTFSVKNSI